MTTVTLPNTSLNVARVCLGTGGIGSATDQRSSEEVLDAYLDGGGNFIDTAHNYGDWDPTVPRSASEKAIGLWMKVRGNRSSIVLATKGGYPHFDAPEIGRLSQADIESDLDGSLDSLQIDTIDLYWLHADEPSRPVGEIMETLNLAVLAGKVRYIGASNWSPTRIREANAYAASHGLAAFVGDQVLWNAAELADYPYKTPTVGFMNRERYEFHLETGMAMIPFQAHAFGLFSRMEAGTLEQMNRFFRDFYKAEESAERYHRMKRVGVETGLTLTQVVLGYLTSQPFATVPIVGSHSAEQVRDSMTACGVLLSTEQIEFIDGGHKGSELP